MKKVIFSAAILFAAYACSKKNLSPGEEQGVSATNTTTQPSPGVSNNPLARLTPIPGANSSHWSDGWCREPVNNCVILPEIVVITSTQMNILSGAAAGDSQDVADAFSSSTFSNICDELDQALVNELQSGAYYIAISNDDSNKINYIFSQATPVADNIEFSLEFSK